MDIHFNIEERNTPGRERENFQFSRTDGGLGFFSQEELIEIFKVFQKALWAENTKGEWAEDMEEWLLYRVICFSLYQLISRKGFGQEYERFFCHGFDRTLGLGWTPEPDSEGSSDKTTFAVDPT